jgi:ATP-dependent DNA helicase PIF1
LIITILVEMVIEGQIMSGTYKGKSVLIPRIALTLKNYKWPFVLQRCRYSIKVCRHLFVKIVFTHGQLYVAISRVTSKDDLKMLLEDENGNCTNETKNVVYKEVLSRLEIHDNH